MNAHVLVHIASKPHACILTCTTFLLRSSLYQWFHSWPSDPLFCCFDPYTSQANHVFILGGGALISNHNRCLGTTRSKSLDSIYYFIRINEINQGWQNKPQVLRLTIQSRQQSIYEHYMHPIVDMRLGQHLRFFLFFLYILDLLKK
jgi:hypothetical protein